MAERRPITEGSRNPDPTEVGYRIPNLGGRPLGGIEVVNGDLMLAHDADGVYVLLAARVALHLSPDEAERIGRVLGWHADQARENRAVAGDPDEAFGARFVQRFNRGDV